MQLVVSGGEILISLRCSPLTGQAGTKTLQPRRRKGREGNIAGLELKQYPVVFDVLGFHRS
jgi:hypothetical protein